jgi:hypothetical protein
VSIKNKLVTAVTTAGLLAGLFGSAFVPAARAAGTDWDADAAATPTVFYDMDHDAAFDAGTSKTTKDGAGTSSYPYFLFSPVVNDGGSDGAAMVAPGELSVLGNTDNCSGGANDDAFCDENGDLLSGTVTAQAVGTAGIVLYVTDGAACSADEDDYTATSNSVNINADADIANEPFLVCVGASDDSTNGAGTVTIKVNGVALDPIYVSLVGPATGITLSASYSFLALDPAADSDAAFTYKFSNGSYSDLNDVYGAAGSVGISNADLVSYESGDNRGDDLDVIIDGDAVNLAAATAGLDDESSDSADAIEADGTNELCDSAAAGLFPSEPGDTHTISVFVDEDADSNKDSDELASNSVTVTCTGDGTEAVVTGAAFDVSSAKLASVDSAYVTFTVEDGYGNKQGYLGDAQTLDFGTDTFSYEPFVLDDAGDITAASTGTMASVDIMVIVDGVGSVDGTDGFEYTVPTTLKGMHYVTINLSDSDLGTTVAVADSWTLSIDITSAAVSGSSSASIAAGPKLKTATITISAAAGKLVTVTIEKVSTGKTFTYYRKANASGVAKFTIRRAGTWEVFASYGDTVTDTVTLKK